MKRNFTRLSVFVLGLVFTQSVFAQTDTTKRTDEDGKLIREMSFVPLPVIAANPANGFMYGLAPSASWLMGSEATTSRSSLVSTIIYTTKKQLILTFKTNVFLKDDGWNLMGDWRYFITSQPTYGLGTGPQSARLVSNGIEYDDGDFSTGILEAQMMEFNYLRLHETALKRFGDSRFFAGVGYHLDLHSKINDQLLNLDTIPPSITSHYAYSDDRGFDPEGYTLSGISLNGLYDSRDNTINPYSGRYAFVSLRINPEFLGSDQSSTMLWAEYRDYFGLSKKRPRHLLALWAYGSFVTSGNVPYLDLPAVGWDQFGRSGRAYPQGRFRGGGVMYGELEYRFPLQKNSDTFGGVLFANATTANNKDANIDLFEYVEPGVGVGWRIMLNKKARTNLTIDYSWGAYGSHGFYLNVNETF
ncbi:outer membrane protein/protective antigen OMA87 [Owenweeksia hongkongensis DSM 17368]|uniref:Outer membrane protein/protective antigen OMA87 n=1 Tax=Owenweeksia hongkongensis (strain DSM 17368 / CIP 108786 / JCM 12287 / NRRL B-23963 / UST20020801) TaxID=926562 RepID=G8R551_OWEHD|nr:BamA/TamA family outer membrane protein [Owenweeksia hongkongensis]AEV31062.1 outer membrane protein/protective antigen OMA87 [Owenweeksia hongkongensis DSM 17368]